MQTDAAAPRVSKKLFWAGWIVSVLPAPMLLFSAAMKFALPKEAVEGFTHLGWPAKLAVPLGIVEVTCTLLYLFPRTAVLGAVLLTGYMGGAIATHVRIEEPFVVQAAIGVVVWLGLYLRDGRVRSLLPFRSPARAA